MTAYTWQETELAFTATGDYGNPYTDLEVWADVAHDDGTTLRRPLFWDGGSSWKLRFAAPSPGTWRVRVSSASEDPGLHGVSREIDVEPSPATTPRNRFHHRGFWRIPKGGRNLVHADGSSALLVADTAWSLPWRATPEQCRTYAADRQTKGFNAALLMSVQPDMDARGPHSRTEDEGFAVGFEDLARGHLNELNADYFRELDELVSILVQHEIVPVWQPVFFGFGWKGLRVAGPVLPPEEYARYCRYLVARYGARPAVYLVGGDGSGYEPPVAAGGEEIERWDCYEQPVGIHYRPHGDNRAHQAAEWLDFQWCQTGHGGEHIPERVADMWRNEPVKAVANGEPSYEAMGATGRAAGWWQGHEAWSNLCAGGTMGVVYGAGSLWQWRLHADEPGHADFFLAAGAGWREAIDFEGSVYVGLVGKILDGLPLEGMAPNWEAAIARRGLLVPGKLFVVYQEHGGGIGHLRDDVPRAYRVVDPRTGEVRRRGRWTPQDRGVRDVGDEPVVIIFCEEEPS